MISGEGEYTYRCIMTNDYESTPEEIVEFYNKRGAKERIFDDLNNSFGWNRLPKSFMNENTVFLLITALIRNFYQFLVQAKDLKSFGLKPTSRLKDFTFKFISVPAKWIKTARQFALISTRSRMRMRPSSNLISDNESRHVEFYSGELLYALWGKGMLYAKRCQSKGLGPLLATNHTKK